MSAAIRAKPSLAARIGRLIAIVVLERSGQEIFVRTPDQSPFPEYPAVMILACLIPTLLCWALVRNWYVAAPAFTDTTP